MISEGLADKISREYGKDLTGYEHVLSDNDIRHIYNRHGPHTPELYPITVEDIKKIPEIIDNPNDAYLLQREDGKVGLMYRFDDKLSTYYLEAVLDAQKKLRNKQMIKVPLGEYPKVKGLNEAIKEKHRIPSG